jgi:hypothetical protein
LLQDMQPGRLAHWLHGLPIMPRMLVTCPESAHLEVLEYVDDPLGMLIAGCSAFQPGCAVTCPRECARRLDRKRGRTPHEPGTVLLARSCLLGTATE